MWDKTYLLSNNSTNVCQQKRVIFHKITYKYKMM